MNQDYEKSKPRPAMADAKDTRRPREETQIEAASQKKIHDAERTNEWENLERCKRKSHFTG